MTFMLLLKSAEGVAGPFGDTSIFHVVILPKDGGGGHYLQQLLFAVSL
jgi:hypothetical protein